MTKRNNTNRVFLQKIVEIKKNSKKDFKTLMNIVLEIFKKDNTEPPNSATFCMAMDLMERNGELFLVKNNIKDYKEPPEILIKR